jgi:hypothetical protein
VVDLWLHRRSDHQYCRSWVSRGVDYCSTCTQQRYHVGSDRFASLPLPIVVEDATCIHMQTLAMGFSFIFEFRIALLCDRARWDTRSLVGACEDVVVVEATHCASNSGGSSNGSARVHSQGATGPPGSPAVIWIQVAVAHGAHTLGSFPADRGCSPLLVKLGRDCWAVLAHGGQLSSCGIVRVV